MNKITAGIGSFALVAGSAFFVASAQEPAVSATPSVSVAAVQSQSQSGEWVWTWTEWQSDENKPVDQFGPDVQWGERQERQVVDQPAWTETIPGEPSMWSNFQPNNTNEPFEGPPVWPYDERGTWSEPKELPGGHAGPDGVYQHGGGHGSWFYRQAGTADQTIEHAATYLTEYRWAVATWVEGPDDGGDTTPPDPEQPDDGGVGDPEGPTQPGPAQPEKDVTPDVTEPAVPIKIDAGL